jgi:hypothetical protein
MPLRAAAAHSLHTLRTRPCSQMLAPPQSLHRLRTRPCSQMPLPPQCLQRSRHRPCCSQRPLRGRCLRSPCRTCVPARARTCHPLPSSLPAPLSSSLSPPLQPPSPPPSPPPLPPRPPPSPPPLSPPPPLSTPVSPPASGTPHRGLSRKMSPMRPARPRFRRELPAGTSLLHALSGCGISLRKGSQFFGLFLFKASMVGSTLLSRSYYYMRRRIPAPPVPARPPSGRGTGGYNTVRYTRSTLFSPSFSEHGQGVNLVFRTHRSPFPLKPDTSAHVTSDQSPRAKIR